MAQPPAYVAEAGPDRWLVKGANAPSEGLRALGFSSRWLSGGLELSPGPRSDEAAAALALALHELGLPFSAGRDWSPSEVAGRLRDLGLADAPFDEIAWTGEGWIVRPLV